MSEPREDPEVLAFIEEYKRQICEAVCMAIEEAFTAVPKIPCTEIGAKLIEDELRNKGLWPPHT